MILECVSILRIAQKRPNYDIIIGPMADRGLKEQFMKMRMEHLTFAEIAPLIHYDKFIFYGE